MDQTLFETCALGLASLKVMSEEKFPAEKMKIYETYKDSYSGDNLWYEQLDRPINEAITIGRMIAPGKTQLLLLAALKRRMELNDDLKPTGGFLKTIGLNGTFFQKSHPAPSSRPDIAIKNIRVVLLLVNAHG